ncbi:hypothetical protein VTI28DRAFT_593 [Corynascus sepedonium]
MRSSIHFILFFLLGLVTSLALPKRQSKEPFTLLAPRNAACHANLTSCRTNADCCSGLKCESFDEEALCVPTG